MSVEESILETLRFLPPEKQQEVLDFAVLLTQKVSDVQLVHQSSSGVRVDAEPASSKPPLGKRLRAIRAKIVASEEPLLTVEQVEQEMEEQRNRLGYFDA